MKTILGIIILLASYRSVSAQTSVLADNADDRCKIKFEKIKSKIDARRKRYEFNVQEYIEGRFCSECGRTKSEIEERAHLNFDQHIRDGAAHKRHALVATQELYHNLYNEYLIDFNDLKKEYDDRYNDCGGDNLSPLLQAISNQQFEWYTIELHTAAIPYNMQSAMFRIDYYSYYAWMMKISITWWQITTDQTSTWFTERAYQTRSVENSVTKAGYLLHNYTQTLAGNQNDFFKEMDAQPTWPMKGTLTGRNK